MSSFTSQQNSTNTTNTTITSTNTTAGGNNGTSTNSTQSSNSSTTSNSTIPAGNNTGGTNSTNTTSTSTNTTVGGNNTDGTLSNSTQSSNSSSISNSTTPAGNNTAGGSNSTNTTTTSTNSTTGGNINGTAANSTQSSNSTTTSNATIPAGNNTAGGSNSTNTTSTSNSTNSTAGVSNSTNTTTTSTSTNATNTGPANETNSTASNNTNGNNITTTTTTSTNTTVGSTSNGTITNSTQITNSTNTTTITFPTNNTVNSTNNTTSTNTTNENSTNGTVTNSSTTTGNLTNITSPAIETNYWQRTITECFETPELIAADNFCVNLYRQILCTFESADQQRLVLAFTSNNSIVSSQNTSDNTNSSNSPNTTTSTNTTNSDGNTTTVNNTNSSSTTTGPSNSTANTTTTTNSTSSNSTSTNTNWTRCGDIIQSHNSTIIFFNETNKNLTLAATNYSSQLMISYLAIQNLITNFSNFDQKLINSTLEMIFNAQGLYTMYLLEYIENTHYVTMKRRRLLNQLIADINTTSIMDSDNSTVLRFNWDENETEIIASAFMNFSYSYAYYSSIVNLGYENLLTDISNSSNCSVNPNNNWGMHGASRRNRLLQSPSNTNNSNINNHNSNTSYTSNNFGTSGISSDMQALLNSYLNCSNDSNNSVLSSIINITNLTGWREDNNAKILYLDSIMNDSLIETYIEGANLNQGYSISCDINMTCAFLNGTNITNFTLSYDQASNINNGFFFVGSCGIDKPSINIFGYSDSKLQIISIYGSQDSSMANVIYNDQNLINQKEHCLLSLQSNNTNCSFSSNNTNQNFSTPGETRRRFLQVNPSCSSNYSACLPPMSATCANNFVTLGQQYNYFANQEPFNCLSLLPYECDITVSPLIYGANWKLSCGIWVINNLLIADQTLSMDNINSICEIVATSNSLFASALENQDNDTLNDTSSNSTGGSQNTTTNNTNNSNSTNTTTNTTTTNSTANSTNTTTNNSTNTTTTTNSTANSTNTTTTTTNSTTTNNTSNNTPITDTDGTYSSVPFIIRNDPTINDSLIQYTDDEINSTFANLSIWGSNVSSPRVYPTVPNITSLNHTTNSNSVIMKFKTLGLLIFALILIH